MKTEEKLLHAIGGVDERLIEEALEIRGQEKARDSAVGRRGGLRVPAAGIPGGGVDGWQTGGAVVLRKKRQLSHQ